MIRTGTWNNLIYRKCSLRSHFLFRLALTNIYSRGLIDAVSWDECTEPLVAQWLVRQHHDVVSVFDEIKGADDREVIRMLFESKWIDRLCFWRARWNDITFTVLLVIVY